MIYNQYPLFRVLKKEDKPLFDEAFSRNPPEISEFTFTNLYTWREIYDIRVCALDGMLILRSDGKGAGRFFPPVGASDPKPVIEKVLEDSGGLFMRVPEDIKSLFDNDKRFSIEPDTDNSDYLFKTQDLILLKGRKYDGKRNFIKKFKSAHKYEYIKLGESNVKECLEFEDRWCSIKDCVGSKGLNDERRAVEKIIENFSSFKLTGGAIRIEKSICAVAVGEKLNAGTFVMHILKADPNITGLYQTIFNEFLSYEARGFKYINLEQDLGLEGLRKFKLSYQPSGMIKKYNLRLK